MAYKFTAEWVKGTKNDAPGALSRNPIADPSPEGSLAELDILYQSDLSITEIRTLKSNEPLSYSLDDLKKVAQEDAVTNNSSTSLYMNFHIIEINYQMLASNTGKLEKASTLATISLFMVADSSFPQNCDLLFCHNFMNPIRVLLEQSNVFTFLYTGQE